MIIILITRSEKEALKRRKKRTPTVAMTAEQYKAKRGILLSTPKKTGWHLMSKLPVAPFPFFLKHVCVNFYFSGSRSHEISVKKFFVNIERAFSSWCVVVLCYPRIKRPWYKLHMFLLSDDTFADVDISGRRKRSNNVSILVDDFDIEKHLERNRRITSNKAKTIQ